MRKRMLSVLVAMAGCAGGGSSPPDATDAGPDTPPAGGCDPRRLAPGEVRAKRIACDAERVGGPNAIARVGDYLLENHRVRFVVRAGQGHRLLGLKGGTVVDADRAREPGEPGGDRLQELLPLTSFAALDVSDVAIASPGGTGAGNEAVVRVTGTPMSVPVIASYVPGLPIPDANVSYEYALAPDSDHLVVRTRVAVPPGKAALDAVPVDGWFCSGALPSFDPGRGWRPGGALPLLVHAAGEGDVSYGYLGGPGFRMQSVGDFALAMGDPVAVDAGAEAAIERLLFVGDGTASSVTGWAAGRIGIATGAVSGCVSRAGGKAEGALVTASDAQGRVLTAMRTGADGCFAGRLPVGAATLVASFAGSDAGPAAQVEVTAAGTTGLALLVPAPSGVRLTARDEGGAPIPARVTIERTDRDGFEPAYAFAWPAGAEVRLPAGRYRLTFSRGFEFGRSVAGPVDVAGVVPVEATVVREVATPGAIAAEFHVHSESSIDSFVTLPERVTSCAAEGLEFVVSTDHDFVTDYRPVVVARGLRPFLATVPGQELSGVTAGHANAWPIEPDPDRAGNGGIEWFGLAPGDLARHVRDGHPARIVQANHPRFQDNSLFDIIGLDPANGHAHADPVALGFPAGTDLDDLPYDSMEVYNGIGDEDTDEVLRDWFALLNAGRRITATAGGDSHDLEAFPGHPRNMVLADGSDDPATLEPAAIDAAVRAMRVVVTTGPYIEAGVVDPGTGTTSRPGDTVTDTDGEVDLRVRVQAPAWMDLSQVEIVVGGEPWQAVPIDDPGVPEQRAVVRMDRSFQVPAPKDTWIVVIARGKTAVPHLSRLPPFALTNPFFVDADGTR
ncbi:MAG: CehA/McbA family metallohydrolase [Deltaproteobacteria bacterium]|nr:CehA/McbA family metallohydrolase [Deltaproteobacteria bacterium]